MEMGVYYMKYIDWTRARKSVSFWPSKKNVAKRKIRYNWFQVNYTLKYWRVTVVLLHDIIFINTHENVFYTFYLYIYVIMNLLRKVLKGKKKG